MKQDLFNSITTSCSLGVALAFGIDAGNLSAFVCLAAGFAYFSLVCHGKMVISDCFRSATPLGVFFLLLICFNVSVLAVQTAAVDYAVRGLRIGLQQAIVAAIFVDALWRFRRFGVPFMLGILAAAFCIEAACNVGADRIGLSLRDVEGIQEGFGSNFDFAQYRWVAPLSNSWHLSGVLRWSVATLLLIAVPFFLRKNPGMAAWALLSASVGIVVSVMLQYRTSIFPLFAGLVWISVMSRRLRIAVTLGCFAYFVAAPFLWSSHLFVDRITEMTPSWLLLAAGNQDATGIFALSGRTEIYELAVASIGSFPKWWGMGHRLYDGSLIIGILPGTEERYRAFVTLPFHQGFLDLMAIYGVIPALVIVSALLYGVLLAAKRYLLSDRLAADYYSDCGSMLLSSSLLFVSLSQDTFLKEDNSFYFVLVASLPIFRLVTTDTSRVSTVLSGQN